ncbi:hypothetical protein Tco_1525765 [Tanacetum coccineum]
MNDLDSHQQVLVNHNYVFSMNNAYVNVHECEKCLELETELLNKKDFIEKETYDKLDNSVSNQSALSFDQYFELNELKAQSQEKDTVIKKLKERIKSLSGNMNEDNVKKDIEEIATINIELDHRVSKLIAENEHLKQTYKQLYDSIKPTRDALIAQINAKSVENSDLNAQLQEKVFAITALKEELRKLKGKSVIACRDFVNKPKVIAPVVHKVDLEPLSPKLKNNREAHEDYIRITKENADTLRDIVEQARTSNPLDNALAYACMYTKQIQELLVYVSDTCPSSLSKSEKLVAVTPMNKARKVTFAKTSTTSDNNTQIQVDVHQTQTTNKPLVPSTNEKCSTNASRSKPRSETKNNRIMQPLSSNQKYQKVEAHTRNAKPSLTKEDSEFKSVCLTCNKCYFDARHDFCVVQHLSEVNDHARAKAVKSIKMKEWKPTEHQSDTYVFTMIDGNPALANIKQAHGRFDTSAGNPVKVILLKLNLPDHRILKDGGEVIEWYPHLDNGIYDIVDRVMPPLALVQERKDCKDRGIKKGRLIPLPPPSPFITDLPLINFMMKKKSKMKNACGASGCVKVVGKGYQRSVYEEKEVNEDEVY